MYCYSTFSEYWDVPCPDLKRTGRQYCSTQCMTHADCIDTASPICCQAPQCGHTCIASKCRNTRGLVLEYFSSFNKEDKDFNNMKFIIGDMCLFIPPFLFFSFFFFFFFFLNIWYIIRSVCWYPCVSQTPFTVLKYPLMKLAIHIITGRFQSTSLIWKLLYILKKESLCLKLDSTSTVF